MLGCTGLKITLLKFNQNGNTVVIILFFLNIFQIKVVRLENLWEEISFENAHSRTVSNATNEDFFIARTIKGHNSAKLSAETSTTGTFSKRADIFSKKHQNHQALLASALVRPGANNVHVSKEQRWRFAITKRSLHEKS